MSVRAREGRDGGLAGRKTYCWVYVACCTPNLIPLPFHFPSACEPFTTASSSSSLPSAPLPLLPVPSCLPWTQDIFSLGCVIAELWLGEGRAFFDLGTLLAYRRGEYDPGKELAGAAAGVVEPDIAELVLHMIQRNPGACVGGGVECVGA